MVTGLLSAFQTHLAENPLPSRRRQGASAKTIQGYVQDITHLPALVAGELWRRTNHGCASGPIHFA